MKTVLVYCEFLIRCRSFTTGVAMEGRAPGFKCQEIKGLPLELFQLNKRCHKQIQRALLITFYKY